MVDFKIEGKPLIVGKGEMGTPLLEIVRGVYPDAEWLDVAPKMVQGKIGVMHICFPYSGTSDTFVDEVCRYIDKFKPELTLIESTVLPGTTGRIHTLAQQPICHSPVRGNIADGFKWGLFTYTKFIGPVNPESAKMAEQYYRSLGFKTKVCRTPLETEFMKVIETSYYGVMIGWFQEVHRICEGFQLDEKTVVSFLESITEESGWKHLRPTFYPGFISGRCVIPNALLLRQVFPSRFIDALLESNEQRRKELDEAK